MHFHIVTGTANPIHLWKDHTGTNSGQYYDHVNSILVVNMCVLRGNLTISEQLQNGDFPGYARHK